MSDKHRTAKNATLGAQNAIIVKPGEATGRRVQCRFPLFERGMSDFYIIHLSDLFARVFFLSVKRFGSWEKNRAGRVTVKTHIFVGPNNNHHNKLVHTQAENWHKAAPWAEHNKCANMKQAHSLTLLWDLWQETQTVASMMSSKYGNVAETWHGVIWLNYTIQNKLHVNKQYTTWQTSYKKQK